MAKMTITQCPSCWTRFSRAAGAPVKCTPCVNADASAARVAQHAIGDGPARRRCLCCRQEFASAGWANRMCDSCLAVAAARGSAFA